METRRENGGKKRRWIAVFLVTLFFILGALGVLQMGSCYTEKSWTHVYPSYEKEDISLLLEKESLTEQEYERIYRQTGVTKLGVEDMRYTKEGRARLLDIQATLFSDIEVKSRLFAPFTYMDETTFPTTAYLCALRDGDIIVSATTRVSWWRYGHAALVVDGKNGVIAEIVGPGEKSATDTVDVYRDFANFLVLRPKVDEGVKAQLVHYVLEEMMGIPYRFTTGILTKKEPAKLKFSQCAHFVWYAYKKFGYDLDGNGGRLVKPQDMALSEKVEVVQAFGFDLDTLWS